MAGSSSDVLRGKFIPEGEDPSSQRLPSAPRPDEVDIHEAPEPAPASGTPSPLVIPSELVNLAVPPTEPVSVPAEDASSKAPADVQWVAPPPPPLEGSMAPVLLPPGAIGPAAIADEAASSAGLSPVSSEGESGPLFGTNPFADSGSGTGGIDAAEVPMSLLEEPANPETAPAWAATAEPAVTFAPAAAPVPETAPPASGASGLHFLLVTILFTWASTATIVALWLWWTRPEPHSPLEDLPDDGKLTSGVVSPLERISRWQTIPLGTTKQIGLLEITPVKIEQRPAVILPDNFLTEPVLVLHLRLKNLSAEQELRPTDPAYLYPARKAQIRSLPMFRQRGYTYSFIQEEAAPDHLVFCYDLAYEQGLRFEGQEFPLLKPGDEVETDVFSEEVDLKTLKADLIWRVKLRKGKTRSGKGVATVIAIPFARGDVSTVAPAAAPAEG